MHAHIMGLIEEYGLIYHWTARPTKAMASYEFEEIWIPKIKSRISYATALHELGHIRGGHRASRWRIVRERDGWAWAKSHALVWTETMQRKREKDLSWYEAQIKAGSQSRFVPATIVVASNDD